MVGQPTSTARRTMRHGGHPRAHTFRWLEDPGRSLTRFLRLAHHALRLIEQMGPALAVAAAGVALVGLTIRSDRRRRLARSARLVLIGVPPNAQSQGGLLLWSALHDLLVGQMARLLTGQPHLAWEMSAEESGTIFRIWVPEKIPPGLIERTIASAWPGASTTVVPAGTHAPGRHATWRVSSELVLSGPDWFALNRDVKPDPMPLILGQLSGLSDQQRALVQILARPATRREQWRLRAAARHLRAGVPMRRTGRALDHLTLSPRARSPLDPTISRDVRDVLDKSSQPLFRCLVRVAVDDAQSRAAARGRMDAVIGGFAPYQGRVGLRRRRMRRPQLKLRDRWLGGRAFLVSTGELAALAHLPSDHGIPGLVRASAREVSPPPGLSPVGKPLGMSGGRLVCLAVPDARQHLHVLGPTGVGKSTLIAQLVLADFREGRGAVVIDPKGDLVEDLLARIPEGREDDVDLLDPMDAAPLAINMLDNADRDLGVDQLVAIFKRVFERDWGPRTDDIFRATLLTLTANGRRATLADVPLLLSNPAKQAELLAHVDDPVGLGPFWTWYQGLSEAQRSSSTGPLLNKLRVFLLRKPVRAIVCATRTTLDIPRCIDGGRLLLARLPKGTLGEDASRLLGSMVVARTWQAALARAAVKPEQRRDCCLYIDEVQNYLNLPTPIPDVLAEARGYRLSLCMAHQHLGQLTPELREGISANARTKIYFQLSRDDAHQLEPDVYPELTDYDLANLPLYTAAVRVCHRGQTGRPFTLTTQELLEPTPGRTEAIKADISRRVRSRYDDAEENAVEERKPAQQLDRRRRYQRPNPKPEAGTDTMSSDLPSC
jgi:Type IV secretion-system coupling protein DNA-binding domain/TraM recognition site of TraD and TraG